MKTYKLKYQKLIWLLIVVCLTIFLLLNVRHITPLSPALAGPQPETGERGQTNSWLEGTEYRM